MAAAKSLTEHTVELGYLTMASGLLALPVVVGTVYLLDRAGVRHPAAVTAAKVGIGTIATFLILRAMPHST